MSYYTGDFITQIQAKQEYQIGVQFNRLRQLINNSSTSIQQIQVHQTSEEDYQGKSQSEIMHHKLDPIEGSGKSINEKLKGIKEQALKFLEDLEKNCIEDKLFLFSNTTQIKNFFLHIETVYVNQVLLIQEGEYIQAHQEILGVNGIKFCRKAQFTLKKWFYDHYSHPYPSKEETSRLAQRCKLTPKQVQIWFINTRGRSNKQQMKIRKNKILETVK